MVLRKLIPGVLFCAVVVLAQGPGRGPGAGPMPMGRFNRTVVKNAPYQADTVTEATQVLADGNRVTNKQSGKLYRDSEGRTRVEQPFRAMGPFVPKGGGTTMISIDDPVAQQRVMLNPEAKSATRMNMPAAGAGNGQGRGGFSRSGTPAAGQGQGQGRGFGDRAAKGNTPNAVKPELKSEPLGTQVIEGVQAQGTRETRTIPAGAIGNDRPIDIVNERWHSPDLQMDILVKHSDPRSGESVYRVTNIRRTEPDKTLFSTPADYTVRDAGRPSHGGAAQQ